MLRVMYKRNNKNGCRGTLRSRVHQPMVACHIDCCRAPGCYNVVSWYINDLSILIESYDVSAMSEQRSAMVVTYAFAPNWFLFHLSDFSHWGHTPISLYSCSCHMTAHLHQCHKLVINHQITHVWCNSVTSMIQWACGIHVLHYTYNIWTCKSNWVSIDTSSCWENLFVFR
jgi:hypothetical protein